MERESPTYEELLKENAKLKARVAELEKYVNFNESKTNTSEIHPYTSYFSNTTNNFDLNDLKSHSTLSKEQIERYSRQLLIPEIGVKGQLKLANSSVLIVGAGGLGAPTSLYLAAAGVGRIGIIDYDSVETSNLHRQVIHSEKSVGIAKAVSARDAVLRLNSSIECIAYDVEFNRTNAIPIIKSYDIVLDASDNMATRYLLNDACVMLNKVLVSGSALRTEGQVTVYNFKGGPCYRCLFPKPPPPESVTNCSEGGVLGVVTGIIGCIQALEAIKVITTSDPSSILAQKLLLFDAMSPRFQIVKLRGRNPKCEVCGDEPTIKELIDYILFCQSGPHDKTPNKNILERTEHISPKDFRDLREKGTEHLLVDVRDSLQFDICSLPNSFHVPLNKLADLIEEVKLRAKYAEGQPHIPVYTLCRRGNDSQDAVKILKSHGFTLVQNIEGGILKWNSDVDPSFPTY